MSVHFPRGVRIVNCSVTMEKCTSTDQAIRLGYGACLAVEDCRLFGGNFGVHCAGKMEARRCMFEGNSMAGVVVDAGQATLVECMVRNSGRDGLYVYGGNVLYGGKVTVAAAEHSYEMDRPQTVSAGNGRHDWATQRGGEIKGLAEGIQVVAI